MNEYIEINIKEGMTPLYEAMENLKSSIVWCKKHEFKCILVIHGYGSTGKGGSIQKKAREWLMAQERNKKIKKVIFGEKCSLFNFDFLKLKNQYQELEPLMKVSNYGVTVVEL